MAEHDRGRVLNRESYDAIVVGSGIGGLTSAALLAKRGLRVLVVEQHYVAGGNATTFRRGGYEFDVGIHYVGSCEPGGIVDRVLREAGVDDVRFSELDRDAIDVNIYDGDKTLRIPAGAEQFQARLIERWPAEEAGIRKYCAAVVEVGKALLDIALKPETGSRPPDVLIPYARRTAREVVHACTEDTWLRTMMLYQHGGYCVAPSEESFIHHSVLAYHYLSTGGFYPIGGGQVMSDRLAAALEKAGGKILLGTMVEKIVVENGRAVGVNLRNKHIGARTVRAGTVLSNADLKRTYSDLLDESILPATSRKRVSNYVMSFGSCVLCLGVKRNLIQHGMSRSNYWVHTSASTEYIYDLARRGEFDQMPGFYLTSPHLKDPDHTKSAPAGISNVQVMTIVPSEPEAWGVTAAQVADGSYRKEPAYLATKALLAKRLLASVDRVLPNFSADVVFSELMTPMTHTRYTLSSGGTGLGIAGLPKQIFLPPPSCRTEIDGLLLCGTNTRFGTGVMSAMAAGWRAAELASRAAP